MEIKFGMEGMDAKFHPIGAACCSAKSIQSNLNTGLCAVAIKLVNA